YDARQFSAAGAYTRPFGTRFKTNLTAGGGAYSNVYHPPSSLGLTEDQRAWLTANYLPQSEKAVYLPGRGQDFQAGYPDPHDFDTLPLSEVSHLGWGGLFRVRWAETAPGSSRRFLEGTAVARYRLYRFDDLATVSAGASIRFQPGELPGQSATWV